MFLTKKKNERKIEEAGPKKPGKVKRYFRSFVNYKSWLAYDELSNNVDRTAGLVKRFASIRKKKLIIKETYKESILRLQLSPEAEEKRRMVFLKSSLIYMAICLFLLGYCFYLLWVGRIVIASLSTIFIIMMGYYAYYNHFWYFQMTKKQLGCTFRGWLNFILRQEVNNEKV